MAVKQATFIVLLSELTQLQLQAITKNLHASQLIVHLKNVCQHDVDVEGYTHLMHPLNNIAMASIINEQYGTRLCRKRGIIDTCLQ